LVVIGGIQEMIDIFGKIIPEELNIGDEYTKKDLAEIFNTSDVKNIIGGIGLVANCMLLLMTLDKSFVAELPDDLDEMSREELEEHSYRHLDYFDINEKVFGWDGPTTMNIESSLMSSFIANVYPCLLFARKHYYKDAEDHKKGITNDKYIYCGKIKYVKHYNSAPLHFISSIEELKEQPNKKLKELYNFKPKILDERLKMFNLLEKKENDEFMELVEREESLTHERKATFAGRHIHKPISTENCMKAIVGFLNEKGGNLMIGIQDDGQVTGVERDCKYKDQDTYHNYMLTQMKIYMGDEFPTLNKYINIRFQKAGENKTKLVCQVNCKPLPPNLVAYIKGNVAVRSGPRTDILNGKETLKWEKNRKK
jgi:hypothetical protein